MSMPLDYLVIPTNIGWTKDGRNVMGRGLAKQAAQRCPQLPFDYGEFCQKHRENTPVVLMRPRGQSARTFLMFPVKPLNRAAPWLSWQSKADILLIDRSLEQLKQLIEEMQKSKRARSKLPAAGPHPQHSDAVSTNIYIPDVGCGNGLLSVDLVRPLIVKHLGHLEDVVHVQYQGSV